MSACTVAKANAITFETVTNTSVIHGEFQKIVEHSGIVWNCWRGALARLGVARANALQTRTSQGVDADAARVRALAGILVARHIKTADELFDSKATPRSESLVAFRRGLATNLHDLGVPDKTIQAILRHANVSVTINSYVKTLDAQSIAAMAQLEKLVDPKLLVAGDSGTES
jgi:hypothetical protein